MTRKTIRAETVHKRWMKDPEYRVAYEELADEFAWASAMVEAAEQTLAALGTTGPDPT